MGRLVACLTAASRWYECMRHTRSHPLTIKRPPNACAGVLKGDLLAKLEALGAIECIISEYPSPVVVTTLLLRIAEYFPRWYGFKKPPSLNVCFGLAGVVFLKKIFPNPPPGKTLTTLACVPCVPCGFFCFGLLGWPDCCIVAAVSTFPSSGSCFNSFVAQDQPLAT